MSLPGATMARMGTNNRQRRRQKQARRQASQSRGSRGGRTVPIADEGLSALMLDATVERAVHATCDGRAGGEEELAELIDLLASGLARGVGRRPVAECLDRFLALHVSALLRQGWDPVDVFQVVRRTARVDAQAAVIATLRSVAPHATPEPWRDLWASQLDRLDRLDPPDWQLDPTASSWAAGVGTAVNLLRVLAHLPVLPDIRELAGRGPESVRVPSRAGSVLDKVRGLLAKAESTDFPEEADALTAKAQELITRHNLQGLLDDGLGDSRATVDARRLWLDDPYIQAKELLLARVAGANRCKAIGSELGFSTVIGFSDDIDSTELLFTSLLVQATRRMAAASAGAPPGARARRASFRRSFLVAYAIRIGARLADTTTASTEEANDDAGGRLLPVLARRRDEVDGAVETLFPDLHHRRSTASDAAGWAAGTAAADLADLAAHQQLDRGIAV